MKSFKIFVQIRIFTLPLVLIFVHPAITGCSTRGGFTMHESMEGVTINAAAAVLIVTPPGPEGSDVAIQLREQVAGHLLEAGRFKSITEIGEQHADYKISVKLTAIDVVSYTSRYHWGALAGSNKIAGDVTVIDVRSGKPVRSFSFHAESAAHHFTGKSGIKDAVDKATEEIMKGLS